MLSTINDGLFVFQLPAKLVPHTSFRPTTSCQPDAAAAQHDYNCAHLNPCMLNNDCGDEDDNGGEDLDSVANAALSWEKGQRIKKFQMKIFWDSLQQCWSFLTSTFWSGFITMHFLTVSGSLLISLILIVTNVWNLPPFSILPLSLPSQPLWDMITNNEGISVEIWEQFVDGDVSSITF